MTAHRLAILDDYQDVALRSADWSRLGPVEVVRFGEHLDAPELVRRLQGCTIVVAMRERTAFPRVVLEQLGDLQLLVTTGAANASIDVAAANERGVTVCGTGGSGAPTVELTWALILAVARQVPREDAATRAGRWQETVGIQLAGCTLGLWGLGRVGSRVATVGTAFGMEVIAWSDNLTDERAARFGARRVERDVLLEESDVLSLHVQLSERTVGRIGERELRAMKPSALLVNTSRGPLVHEASLVRALQEGWLRGVGLDVYDQEPLPPQHPLLSTPNTVLTPHLGYVTEANYRAFYGDAVEDVVRYLAGDLVRVVVARR